MTNLELTVNEATALVSAFNGIARAPSITAHSHLTHNFNWYFSQEAKEYGIDYEIQFEINAKNLIKKLNDLTEDQAQDLLTRIHKFWGNNPLGVPKNNKEYKIPNTKNRLIQVGLIKKDAHK